MEKQSEGIMEFELYKGKVKGKFYGPTDDKPNRHMYYIDGKRKKGVTTILGIKDKSVALMSWQEEETAKVLFSLLEKGKVIDSSDVVKAIFAHQETKEKAADLGKEIHKWIELYIDSKLGKGKTPEMPEDKNVVTGVLSFLQWESEHKVKFLWSEKILYSKKYDYIGCGDFGAKVDGLTCLCDIKTGNGMYNSVLAQTAAYAQADTEESGIKYDGRWGIRLAKETSGEYEKRIAFKNKVKTLLGKKEKEIEPYQVFESKFFDEDPKNMKRDFNGFVSHLELDQWNNETDFYKNKSAV